MTGDDLDRRVRVPAVADEVGRLASTMNALLARIEHVTQSQRRFVADASHELRGPLTRLRSELELGVHPPDEAERASLLGEVVALQQLIEDLLHLARSDAEVGTARAASLGLVDLDDLVLDTARSLRAQTTLTVDTSAVSGGQIRGHAEQLRRMLANLTANATRYAVSSVRLAVHEGTTTVELVVEDDGPGIPQHERERVFERFARVDDARTPGSGAGLGLAIVRDIVDRHGGSVTIDSVSPSGARVVVRFPVSR